jgi:electron transfer flavoprotein beta subunit
MRILVCIKRVPAPGARIVLNPDRRSIDTAHLGFTMSPHEECAVAEAVSLVTVHGGNSTVLTVGPPEAEEQLRYAVSVGIGSAILVTTDGSDWDPMRTASTIVAAINAAEDRDGPFDLILFGNESADSGGYQVGVRVAHALGRPMVNGAKGIEIDGAAVVVRRGVDAGFEVYRLPLPAVVGVREGINVPAYPTLKGRLASKRAQIDQSEATTAPGPQRMVELTAPVEQESETMMLGEGASAAARVVDVLEELGVV